METKDLSYKHILYTTEFSSNWNDVFEHALGLAKQYKAKLSFLHVLHTDLIDLLTFDVGMERSPSIDKKFTEAKDFTSNARELIIRKVQNELNEETLKDIDIIVERGNPVKTIISVAEKKDCDVIVMGFKGRSTIEDAAIGDTVSRVLHRTKLPVLVIHNTKK